MSERHDTTEQLIRQACTAKDFERAATLAVERYGSELLGFLIGYMRDQQAANDVFQIWGEQFWRTLPTFEWRCSARTWAYTIARHTAQRYLKREYKYAAQERLTHLSRLSIAVERVRTATAAYQRTDVKDHFQRLREELSEEDQTILILRVDRDLSWLELAQVMLGEDGAPDDGQLNAEAARLRKRFQHAKTRLRALATAAGLIDDEH